MVAKFPRFGRGGRERYSTKSVIYPFDRKKYLFILVYLLLTNNTPLTYL